MAACLLRQGLPSSMSNGFEGGQAHLLPADANMGAQRERHTGQLGGLLPHPRCHYDDGNADDDDDVTLLPCVKTGHAQCA